MNFSKGFLLTFQLLAIIFQIILIGTIPNINMTYYYIFAVSTVITYFFTTYTTYQIKFHTGDDNSQSEDE